MTYNTGNALGSTDPRDLYDNAENLDRLANGPGLAYADRLGASRKSWAGMEQDFQNFLLASGYQDLGTYAAGLTITARNQIFERSGLLYRLASIQALPYTTTGTWAGESGKFVVITDASLRTELANGGSALVDSAVVGYGASSVKAELDRIAAGGIPGAVGNGVADDTAAFSSFEASTKGRAVDLGGKTYLVTAIPEKNSYYNGSFKLGDYTRQAEIMAAVSSHLPCWSRFGGQLADLKESLCDPLEQLTSIVFIGDSITWGTGTGEGMTPSPADGTLSDPRDAFATPSYVNNLKRRIGKAYANNAAPTLSNWSASPSGESIAEYQSEKILFPGATAQFTRASSSGVTFTEVEASPSSTGRQFRISVFGAASYGEISFPFTGAEFYVGYTQISTGASYELFVNNVSQGVFTTSGATAYNTRRYHSFSFVRGGTVRIRVQGTGDTTISALLEAVIVNKKIRISNQGINGSSSRSYKLYNMPGNTFGDGEAIGTQDGFVFVQLGTNDRIKATNIQASSPSVFYQNLGLLIDSIPAHCKTVLMCANPANDNPVTYAFGMQEVRNTIYRTAKERSIDFIDNYTPLIDIAVSVFADDNLHPNRLGFQVMSQNIIRAIESA